MKFVETLGDMTRRVKGGGTHKPLRSFKELCEELGVPQKTVMGRLKMEGAPVPVLKHNGSRGSAAWYEPAGFKKWWASLEQVKPTLPTRHCEECRHFETPQTYAESLDHLLTERSFCHKSHNPKFYKPKSDNPHATDWGYKRRCENYECLD